MKLSFLAQAGLIVVLLQAGCASQSSTSTQANASDSPASANGAASKAGAPNANQLPVKPTSRKIKLTSIVYFESAKATLSKQSKAALDELMGELNNAKLEVITAVGRTDGKGSALANEKLGLRRAAAVKNYLITKGIAPNQISTQSKIDPQAATEPASQALGAISRRVEIEVTATRSN